MKANKNKHFFLILLILFIASLITSATALVLFLLVGPLHTNPSSFKLTANPTDYQQYKYLQTGHRIFYTANIGLVFSFLSTIVAFICTLVKYRKQYAFHSSLTGLRDCFLQKMYICVSCGALGSIVGTGLQLSVLIQTHQQDNFGEWLSASFAGINQLLYNVILVFILWSSPSPNNQDQPNSPLTPRQVLPQSKKSSNQLYQQRNISIDLNISNKLQVKHPSQIQPVKRPKLNILSTKPRKKKRAKTTQVVQKNSLIPLIATQMEAEKPQKEESEGSHPVKYTKNVESFSSQSQKWKEKVPKLDLQLINIKLKPTYKEMNHLNELDISMIKPLRDVDTSTAQNDQAIMVTSPNYFKPRQLSHSHSVLSHIKEGKIPQEVQKPKKSNVLKPLLSFKPTYKEELVEDRIDESKPNWQRHSISMDSD